MWKESHAHGLKRGRGSKWDKGRETEEENIRASINSSRIGEACGTLQNIRVLVHHPIITTILGRVVGTFLLATVPELAIF